MSAQTRTQISDLLAKYGLAPVHRLGQHFLADANITRKIVDLAGVGPGSQVVEVGAGTGTLTRALARTGARVVAFEIDRGLEPVLAEVTDDVDVELRFEDAAAVDWSGLGEGEWSMVANLPYNVGTPILLSALREAPNIRRFVVMVQREVAERLVAAPGTTAYGLPSVVVGLHGSAKLEFMVPAQVFLPAPSVGSAVVTVERSQAPPESERAIELAAAAFNQRRKMLRRSLAGQLDDPVRTLEEARIDPTARGEELSPADFLRLART